MCKWRALIWDGDTQRSVGFFPEDSDAARLHDRSYVRSRAEAAQANGSPPLDLFALDAEGVLNFAARDYEAEIHTES